MLWVVATGVVVEFVVVVVAAAAVGGSEQKGLGCLRKLVRGERGGFVVGRVDVAARLLWPRS